MICLVEYFVLKNTGHKSPPKYKFKKKKKKSQILYIYDSKLKNAGRKAHRITEVEHMHILCDKWSN